MKNMENDSRNYRHFKIIFKKQRTKKIKLMIEDLADSRRESCHVTNAELFMDSITMARPICHSEPHRDMAL